MRSLGSPWVQRSICMELMSGSRTYGPDFPKVSAHWGPMCDQKWNVWWMCDQKWNLLDAGDLLRVLQLLKTVLYSGTDSKQDSSEVARTLLSLPIVLTRNASLFPGSSVSSSPRHPLLDSFYHNHDRSSFYHNHASCMGAAGSRSCLCGSHRLYVPRLLFTPLLLGLPTHNKIWLNPSFLLCWLLTRLSSNDRDLEFLQAWSLQGPVRAQELPLILVMM